MNSNITQNDSIDSNSSSTALITEERSAVFDMEEVDETQVSLVGELEETRQPLAAETQRPLVEEPQAPLVVETQRPLIAKTLQPLVEETRQPLVEETLAPFIQETQSTLTVEMRSPLTEEAHSSLLVEESRLSLMEEQRSPLMDQTQLPVIEGLGPPPPYSLSASYLTTTANAPGPPPSYNECNNLNVPPPSYESLFGRVMKAHKNSNNIFVFGKNLLILLLGTVGCSVTIGVLIVIPVCMIFIGISKISECPAQRFIPIYLIVGGVLGIIKSILNLIAIIHRSLYDNSDNMSLQKRFHLTFIGVLGFFLTAWFITGCFWIYNVKPNFEDKTSSNYCDFNLYIFAFWMVTSVNIVMGVLISCKFCLDVIAGIYVIAYQCRLNATRV